MPRVCTLQQGVISRVWPLSPWNGSQSSWESGFYLFNLDVSANSPVRVDSTDVGHSHPHGKFHGFVPEERPCGGGGQEDSAFSVQLRPLTVCSIPPSQGTHRCVGMTVTAQTCRQSMCIFSLGSLWPCSFVSSSWFSPSSIVSVGKKHRLPGSQGEEQRPQERVSPAVDLLQRTPDLATVGRLPEKDREAPSSAPPAGSPQDVTYAQLDHQILAQRTARGTFPRSTEPTAESSTYASLARP
uniref:Uncharacterized protein n=1 Tax=Felis catus TaxID=9685 RepID=A0ABI8AN27_FELCA